ncbi:hypothetical protein AAC03nite_38730 [Alicyclobacillus acidoterrestris]|nr:hypothetical protein AAC03nite_38730 [Alicyclobacillus acidoterrestris]
MKGWRLALAGSLVGAVTYVAAPVCVVQADTSGWLTDVGIAESDATPADVETAGLAAIAAAALGTAAYGVSQVDWQSVYNDTSSFAQDAWAWAQSNVDAYGGLLSSWGAGTSSAAISLSGSLLSGLQNWLQSEWSKVDSSTAVQFGQTIASTNTSKVYTFGNGDTYTCSLQQGGAVDASSLSWVPASSWQSAPAGWYWYLLSFAGLVEVVGSSVPLQFAISSFSVEETNNTPVDYDLLWTASTSAGHAYMWPSEGGGNLSTARTTISTYSGAIGGEMEYKHPPTVAYSFPFTVQPIVNVPSANVIAPLPTSIGLPAPGNLVNDKGDLAIPTPVPTTDGTVGLTWDGQNAVDPTGTTVPVDDTQVTAPPTTGTQTGTSTLSDVIDAIKSLATDIENFFDFSKPIDWSPMEGLTSVMSTRFPFSIPWDLKDAVTSLVATPQLPDLQWAVWSPNGALKYDLPWPSFMDTFADITRAGGLLAFNIGLLFAMRKLMGADV